MKSLKINSRTIIPAVTFLLGLLWVFWGLKNYGWWEEGPGSGFFPAIIGILLSGISIIAFMEGRKMAPPAYIPASFHPFMAAIGTILAAMVIGFFPALFLFILGWMRLYEKFPWIKAILTSVITIATVFGVFVLWLRVPFPAGLILDLIRG